MRVPIVIFLAILMTARIGLAQGTFQYDQQSLNHSIPPDVLWDIQPNQPIGQSFIPSLSAVGFVQLDLHDGNPNNGLGATLYVNLRSNSMTGFIVTTTSAVFLPDTTIGGGVTNFLFSAPAAVVPGVTYFFEIVVQSGDTWRLNSVANLYSSGTMFVQGAAQPLEDLWFREGIIVPEPSAALISFVVGAAWICLRRRR